MKLSKFALYVFTSYSLFVYSGCDSELKTDGNENKSSKTSSSAAPTPGGNGVAPPISTASTNSNTGAGAELAEARMIYKRNCSVCHGASGQGNPTWNTPSLKEGKPLKETDEALRLQIMSGGNGMPPYKDSLTSAQIAALVELIRRDFQGRTK